MDEMADKILVELILTLALVTKELKQRRSNESVLELLADVFPCSAQRSQSCKEILQGEGHRGSPGEA